MKIVQLIAENVKKLVAVEINPDGNLVQITGKNGQGKTSVLDSIWWALAGATNIQKAPIRTGMKDAKITLRLKSSEREIVVKRKFGRKEDGSTTTSMSVETPDGAIFKSPQNLLNELLGELCFDPLKFARMDAKEQYDALRGFVPGVDFEAIDKLNEADVEKRKNFNREADNARGAAASIEVPADAPVEVIDEQAIVNELDEAHRHNQDVNERQINRDNVAEKIRMHRDTASNVRGRLEKEFAAIVERREANIADINSRAKDNVSNIESQIAALEEQIISLRGRIDDAVEAARLIVITERERMTVDQNVKRQEIEAEAQQATKEADRLQTILDSADPLQPLKDIDAIKTRIGAAKQNNVAYALAEQREGFLRKAAELEAQSDKLTRAIKERDKEKREAIAAAKMPVPGLDFGDQCVLLNELPFEQASDAERLRASVAIAMAMNPNLRVIRIRDGSLLDEDAMKLLAEMADANDMQVWIERVDGSGKVGFVLEDGHLKAADIADTAEAQGAAA